MRTRITLILLLALVTALGARDGRGRYDYGLSSRTLPEAFGIEDRAQNVITINQLGQTVTNLGQFYAYSGVLPQARWPLSTDHDAMWKMCLYVGIPGNVVQTRATRTKEWDAVAGYHNPDSGLIAISTDPQTWPRDGSGNPYWPVRTVDGRDSIRSQMDTYAVYRDRTNNRALVSDPPDWSQLLNIEVHQSTWAWNTSKDDDYIIFEFDIINDTTLAKDSVYFGLYTDLDAGGIVDEYVDDRMGVELDRQLFYVYDSDGRSRDWRTVDPFYIGLVILETPEVNGVRPGVTDFHYSDVFDSPWGDVPEEDSIVYQWMSSDPALRDNPNWPNLFHGDDLKIDNVNTISQDGMAVDCIIATGPYRMEAGERMRLRAALVVGADYDDLSRNVDRVWEIYNNGLQLIPPPQPEIRGSAFDNRVVLSWSNAKEFGYLNEDTGETLIQEYRVYRTRDPQRNDWGEPVAIIPQDSTLDDVVEDAYVWEDPEPTPNYFFYSYTVTSYDADGLESGIANLTNDQVFNTNTAELRPVASARSDLDAVRVVPNPYVISAQWERKRLGDPIVGEPVRDLAFTNLPERCTIRIFSLDGDLVKTLEHSGAGTAFWDVRSDFNQLVATGVYVYHIESADGETTGKFAIIR